jgi:glycosyltransferase involved in cell wall biosynthesis
VDEGPVAGPNEEGLVITVGAVNRSNIKRKGLEALVKAVKLLPDARVVIVGKNLDDST